MTDDVTQADCPDPDPDEKWTTRQAAEYIGVTENTLLSWRSSRNRGPKYKALDGRFLYYLKSEVVAWAAEHIQEIDPSERVRAEAI